MNGMINDQTAGRIVTILVAAISLIALIVVGGAVWIAISHDGQTTTIVLTAFTTLMGVLGTSLTFILHNYLTNQSPSPPTTNTTNITTNGDKPNGQ